MRAFFTAPKDEAIDHASRQVRSALGKSFLRDTEDDFLLPPHWTKRRRVSEKWLWKNGWVPNCTADGNYGKLSSFGRREYDGIHWVEGVHQQGNPVAKTTFMALWNNEFSKIRIASQSKDTCDVCWKYKAKMAELDMRSSHMMNRRIEGDDNEVNAQELQNNIMNNIYSVQLLAAG